MEPDDLNAIVIIASALFSICLAIFLRDKARFREVQVYIIAGILFIFGSFVSASFNLHNCYAGNPFMQWLIPSLCASIVWIFVKQGYVRLIFAPLLLLVGFGISHQFTELVHRPSFTGNPVETLNIRNVQIENCNDEAAGFEKCPLPIITRNLWHSWLTGIYRVEEVTTESE